jgi:hypothetical protein
MKIPMLLVGNPACLDKEGNPDSDLTIYTNRMECHPDFLEKNKERLLIMFPQADLKVKTWEEFTGEIQIS